MGGFLNGFLRSIGAYLSGLHDGHLIIVVLVLGVVGLALWACGLRIQHHLQLSYGSGRHSGGGLGSGSPEARKQWARRLADASFDGLLIHRNGTILQMNRALVRMLGYREMAVVGTHFSNFTHPAMMAALRTELEAPQPQIAEFVLLHADKSERFVEMASHTLEYDGLPATVTAIRNVSAQRSLEARLAHLTHNDLLTGLPNRAQFSERLNESVTRNDRAGGTTAVLTIELDQLKAINEKLGRAGGDSLLRQIAGRLMTLAHESDTVARLGGDKFGIVQPHTGAPNRTASLASQIETSFDEPFIVEGKSVSTSMSIGIALYPEHATDADGLLRASSLAMDLVSQGGGGGFRMFNHADSEPSGASPGRDSEPNKALGYGAGGTPSGAGGKPQNSFRATMSGASMGGGLVSGSQRLAQDLRLAIPRGEISLDYQPILAARFLSIAGFEALPRWRHPRDGVIAADKFVPLADEAGLSFALGNFILESACVEAVRCKSPLMAVNLSPLQFRDPQLPGRVSDILRKTGMLAERLEIGVTESMLTGDPALALRVLQSIRSIGIGVTLDDFGAGLSSLGGLSDFPFNKIKIDKRFIQALGIDANAEAIVAAILALARNLRIEVTAKGVESEAQLTYLQEKGCNFIQGDHIGRAAPQASAFSIMSSGGSPGAVAKPTLVVTQR